MQYIRFIKKLIYYWQPCYPLLTYMNHCIIEMQTVQIFSNHPFPRYICPASRFDTVHFIIRTLSSICKTPPYVTSTYFAAYLTHHFHLIQYNTTISYTPYVALAQVNFRRPCLPSGRTRTWNSLPASVRAATSLSTFRQELKIFLFRSSYYGHYH